MSQYISCKREGENIDVFMRNEKNNELIHIWQGPETNWEFKAKVIARDCASNPSGLGKTIDYDVYYVSLNGELIHLWKSGHNTNEEFSREVIYTKVSKSETPRSIRFDDYIDVYCLSQDFEIVHLFANTSTSWKYVPQILNKGKSIKGLCPIRNKEEYIDLYFCENGKISHMWSGDENGWKGYNISTIFEGKVNTNVIRGINENEEKDVFFCDEEGFINRLHNPNTHQGYVDEGRVFDKEFKVKNNYLDVVCWNHHIDLYFIGENNKIYHSSLNGNKWSRPEQISDVNAVCISAVKSDEKAINIFFIDENGKLGCLCTGSVKINHWGDYLTAQNLTG